MHCDTKIEYAAAGDFCSIFQSSMASFYQLAFLLTADQNAAELVFLAALEECLSNSAVFKERASSWARRAIVTNAIRAVAPVPSQASNARAEERSSESDVVLHFSEPNLTRLTPFTRFAFVMTVLENFSVTESAIMLRSTQRDVINARLSAVLALAQQIQRTYIPGSRGAATLNSANSRAAQSPDLHHEMMFSEITA